MLLPVVPVPVVPDIPGAVVFGVPLPTLSEPMALPLESVCCALARVGSAMAHAANAAIISLDCIRSLSCLIETATQTYPACACSYLPDLLSHRIHLQIEMAGRVLSAKTGTFILEHCWSAVTEAPTTGEAVC